MADDRPVEDPATAIVALRNQLNDLQSTVNARVGSRPTGDIEPTLRLTPKAGALFLDGSAVSRTTYAVLWQWVQDQGLIISGLFTVGDGSTTFGLPNFQGRVVIGVGTLSSVSYALGATGGNASITLTAANLANHTHTGTISSDGQHQHGFLTAQGGDHGSHFPTGTINVSNGTGTVFGLAAWNSAGSGSGTHNHDGTTAFNSNHNHTVTVAGTGTTTAVDPRPPYIAINWEIWT